MTDDGIGTPNASGIPAGTGVPAGSESTSSTDYEVIVADGVPDSPARVHPPTRPPVRWGLVQQRWHPDPDEHRAALAEGVRLAAAQGATVVCLQEMTLLSYCAIVPGGPDAVGIHPEPLPGGPTHRFASDLAAELGIFVHASVYEADPAVAPRGYNTAICVAPDGTLVARTRKLHIPITAGYYEDLYFAPGDTGYPVVDLPDARAGFPTCWDEWFPELARIYSLQGAEVLVYPTAIGSEPDHPNFDTMPLWRQVIVANGITAGTFMVVPNRIGTETLGGTSITFYGSSFMSDPYGRVLVEAPRDRPAVLVADLDLDQRRDWLELFPFDRTRRPDTYGRLVEP
jgi:N-carbamoylputrescine amidase